jgi:hypothetical protein
MTPKEELLLGVAANEKEKLNVLRNSARGLQMNLLQVIFAILFYVPNEDCCGGSENKDLVFGFC